jgi:hypothetical protein
MKSEYKFLELRICKLEKLNNEHPFNKWINKNLGINDIDNNNYVHIDSILNLFIFETPEFYENKTGDLYYRLLHIINYDYPKSYIDLDNYYHNIKIYNIKKLNNKLY